MESSYVAFSSRIFLKYTSQKKMMNIENKKKRRNHLRYPFLATDSKPASTILDFVYSSISIAPNVKTVIGESFDVIRCLIS